MELKVRKIGNGYGILLPKQLMEALCVQEGSTLHAIQTDGTLQLTPFDPDFARALAAFAKRSTNTATPIANSQNSMLFLTEAMVRAIHSDLIARYGGAHGLRDAALLQSALARPQMLAHYQPHATLPELGATLAWGFLRNDPFVDGNKRIGFAALVTFLHLHGFHLTCTEIEETAALLRVASSQSTEPEWTTWVTANAAPGKQP